MMASTKLRNIMSQIKGAKIRKILKQTNKNMIILGNKERTRKKENKRDVRKKKIKYKRRSLLKPSSVDNKEDDNICLWDCTEPITSKIIFDKDDSDNEEADGIIGVVNIKPDLNANNDVSSQTRQIANKRNSGCVESTLNQSVNDDNENEFNIKVLYNERNEYSINIDYKNIPSENVKTNNSEDVVNVNVIPFTNKNNQKEQTEANTEKDKQYQLVVEKKNNLNESKDKTLNDIYKEDLSKTDGDETLSQNIKTKEADVYKTPNCISAADISKTNDFFKDRNVRKESPNKFVIDIHYDITTQNIETNNNTVVTTKTNQNVLPDMELIFKNFNQNKSIDKIKPNNTSHLCMMKNNVENALNRLAFENITTNERNALEKALLNRRTNDKYTNDEYREIQNIKQRLLIETNIYKKSIMEKTNNPCTNIFDYNAQMPRADVNPNYSHNVGARTIISPNNHCQSQANNDQIPDETLHMLHKLSENMLMIFLEIQRYSFKIKEAETHPNKFEIINTATTLLTETKKYYLKLSTIIIIAYVYPLKDNNEFKQYLFTLTMTMSNYHKLFKEFPSSLYWIVWNDLISQVNFSNLGLNLYDRHALNVHLKQPLTFPFSASATNNVSQNVGNHRNLNPNSHILRYQNQPSLPPNLPYNFNNINSPTTRPPPPPYYNKDYAMNNVAHINY